MSTDVWHPTSPAFSFQQQKFSDILVFQGSIVTVFPRKLHNADWRFTAERRQALLPHTLIEINRFPECLVLNVHHCSMERIHQNQSGALHSLQPITTLISELQSLNITTDCSLEQGWQICQTWMLEQVTTMLHQTCLCTRAESVFFFSHLFPS